LKLAQPGGWVRPFVVPGPEMRSLFDCLNRNEFNGSYVDAIITALDDEKTGLSGTVSTPQTPSSLASAEYNPAAPLTQREIDILDLLKGRLSNQEIADILFISPETVKRHLYNIYKKLSVKNRREASAKITALNILP
jgi:DNA-binding CsgD family transcriptional regulator